MDGQSLYTGLVFLHIVLFAAWLGGDIGVFALGQHFRKRHAYALETRLTLLKLLVLVDMAPRTAWALMVPVSVSMAVIGGWAALPGWLVQLSWAVGLGWLALTWAAYLAGQTPRAKVLRQAEFYLTMVLAAGYGALTAAGFTGLIEMPAWLAVKAGLFALIFVFAIMIDVMNRPVGPLLQRLIAEGSSAAAEDPLLAAMNRVRVWVLGLYVLLLAVAAVGTFKPAL